MFAVRLKTLREERGWSQSELARRAKLTPNAISQLEDIAHPRWPEFKTFCFLSHAFEMSMDELGGDLCEELWNAAQEPAQRV